MLLLLLLLRRQLLLLLRRQLLLLLQPLGVVRKWHCWHAIVTAIDSDLPRTNRRVFGAVLTR